MARKEATEWIRRTKNYQILKSFSHPNTPSKVEQKLCMKKLKLKPFLEKNFIICLNPNARKGRYYGLTNKAKESIDLKKENFSGKINWNLIGWIMASPKQRLVVLKTISIDCQKRTSEAIRARAYRINPNLTRISTKGILKELISRGLIESEIIDKKRVYWINKKGRKIIKNISDMLAKQCKSNPV